MSDDKSIRGPIDQVFVALTEPYELNFFVDQYLKTRQYDLTDANRQTVRTKIALYSGRAPIQRDDLNAFLDKGWKN